MFVASREFTVAAEAQSAAIGFPAAAVFVPHPIQDRTDEEMQDLADSALSALLGAITEDTEPPTGQPNGAIGRDRPTQ